MKENKAITLVSLVVTIIILIIVAGISINMTLGEEGIITIAKKAKENMELAQIEEQTKVNELYSQLEENKGIIGGNLNYDAIAKLNEFKKAIADSIEEAGGIKPEYTADTETFGERIKEIVKEVTKNATATEGDILEGKTAWVNGELITGNGLNFNLNSESAQLLKFSHIGVNTNCSYTYTCNDDSFVTYVHYTHSNNGAGSGTPTDFTLNGKGKILYDTGRIEYYDQTTGRVVIFTMEKNDSFTANGKYHYLMGIK